MSITITCPDCRATLKANKTPRPEKLLQCLKCRHRFTMAESRAAATHLNNEPLPLRIIDAATKKPLWLAGGVAVALVFVGGIVALTIAMRPAPLTPKPKIADVAVVEKAAPEPKVEPKVEAKVEPKIDIESERKRELYTHLMIDGGIAVQLKKFDEAVAAYTDAIKIFPDAADAQKKLADASAAFEVQEKARREQELVHSDTAALIKRGQTALDKEQFPAAIEFFKLALAKSPTNEDAAEKLVLAQDLLQKNDVEKKKLDLFDQHILNGKAALQAGRAADAIREFVAAGKALPNDPLPGELLKEAEKQFVQAKNQDDRKKQYQALLDQGAVFLRGKHNDDAEDVYRQALKLYPNDPTALRGLESAQAATKKAKANVANLMAQAQNAIAMGQLPNAMIYLRDAQQISPNNAELQRAVRAAELIQANQAVYYQAINRATAAMNLRRYGDAIVAYTDALQIVPDDPLATVGLIDAQRGFGIYTIKKREYDVLVNQGVASLKAQHYTEAARTLEAAGKLMRPPLLPDPQVQSLTRYAEAMSQGNAALNARQFPQATQFFQLALAEVPGDLAAQGALQKARLKFNGK